MALGKIRDPRKIRHWMGHMETDYVYTLGIAGERFFKEIQENARIMGAKCSRCNIIYVPPKMYCERCFSELKEWIEVGSQGTVHTYTIAHIDIEGERLKQPIVYAFIKMKGTNSGIVHKLGEISPENARIGMSVEAVFKPREERVGSINDIKYFRPIK